MDLILICLQIVLVAAAGAALFYCLQMFVHCITAIYMLYKVKTILKQTESMINIANIADKLAAELEKRVK